MNKQKVSKHPSLGNSGRNTVMEDRYYVQRITEQIFVIRERTSEDGETGPNDRIIKSFDMRHDAYTHVDTLNEKHRKLDTEMREG
ncbi:MAG: hypothetical protein NVS4B11_10320 [Ktedonobacteraceae bacterium]